MEVLLHWLPALGIALVLGLYAASEERKIAKLRLKRDALKKEMREQLAGQQVGGWWYAGKRRYTAITRNQPEAIIALTGWLQDGETVSEFEGISEKADQPLGKKFYRVS